MEKKVLYNFLKAISKGNRGDVQAPDSNYTKSLENIGMIKIGWDVELTDFGRQTLEWLKSDIEKW